MRINISKLECKVDCSAVGTDEDFRVHIWDSCPNKGHLTVHYPGKTISLSLKKLRALLKTNEEIFEE